MEPLIGTPMPDNQISTEQAMGVYMATWIQAQGLVVPDTEVETVALFSMLPMPPVTFVDWCERMGQKTAAAPIKEKAMLAINDAAAGVAP